MGIRGDNPIDRKQKFSPDPASPLDVASQRISMLEREVRLLRQNLQVPTIHTFDSSQYIDPTQGEIFWDFQFQRGYIWHHDHYRPLAPPTFHIKLFADDKPVTTTKPFTFGLSKDLGGWTRGTGEPYPTFRLYDAEAYITESGSCTVSVTNITTGQALLSSNLVISGLHDDGTATIDQTKNCSWKDQIKITVVSAGGKGLGVMLVFNPVIPA